ncbi:MAG TPA: hypothetical protein VN901_28105 [Candidatus Acidoferrales bacterium]|nr:hypothetical protein [Candidatus Acidoferrales bacterium]
MSINLGGATSGGPPSLNRLRLIVKSNDAGSVANRWLDRLRHLQLNPGLLAADPPARGILALSPEVTV